MYFQKFGLKLQRGRRGGSRNCQKWHSSSPHMSMEETSIFIVCARLAVMILSLLRWICKRAYYSSEIVFVYEFSILFLFLHVFFLTQNHIMPRFMLSRGNKVANTICTTCDQHSGGLIPGPICDQKNVIFNLHSLYRTFIFQNFHFWYLRILLRSCKSHRYSFVTIWNKLMTCSVSNSIIGNQNIAKNNKNKQKTFNYYFANETKYTHWNRP